jgi:hypothetical protein
MSSYNSIKKLRTIGVNEISKSTHITVKTLEQIINKDFDSLDKTKTIGFLDILSSKYTIDFREYEEEFKKAKEESEDKKNKAKEPVKQRDYTTMAVVGVAVLLVWIIYFLFISEEENIKSDEYKQDSSIETIKANIENSKRVTRNIQIAQAEEIASDTNITSEMAKSQEPLPSKDTEDSADTTKLEDNNTLKQENTTKDVDAKDDSTIDVDKNIESEVKETIEPTDNKTYEQNIASKKENAKKNIEESKEKKIQNNSSDLKKQTEQQQGKVESSIDKPITTVLNMTKDSFIIETKNPILNIRPKSALWIGIIYLNKNQKKDDTITTKKSYKLENDMIVATGHSHMEFEVDGISYSFQGNKQHYFYVTDSKLIEISKKDYFKLSGKFRW